MVNQAEAYLEHSAAGQTLVVSWEQKQGVRSGFAKLTSSLCSCDLYIYMYIYMEFTSYLYNLKNLEGKGKVRITQQSLL